MAHLVIHGVLHLLGFEHSEESDTDSMSILEEEIINTLGLCSGKGD
jgi:probable rRNA maturation factor